MARAGMVEVGHSFLDAGHQFHDQLLLFSVRRCASRKDVFSCDSIQSRLADNLNVII